MLSDPIELNELATHVRSRYCVLYGAIADASGHTVTALFDLLRHYWLKQQASAFHALPTRVPDPAFVRVFELIFGRVQVVTESGGQGGGRRPNRVVVVFVPDSCGLLRDNSPAGRTLKRFFVMYAILCESSFRDYLVPLPATSVGLELAVNDERVAATNPHLTELRRANLLLAERAKALDVALSTATSSGVPAAIEAYARASVEQAEARLRAAKAARLLRLGSLPRCNPFALAALLEPTQNGGGCLLANEFATLADGVRGYHIGHLMDTLDTTFVVHSNPACEYESLLGERAAEARRRATLAALTTQHSLAQLVEATKIARSNCYIVAAGLLHGAVEKHGEAERIESALDPPTLARINNRADEIDEALSIRVLTTMLPA